MERAIAAFAWALLAIVLVGFTPTFYARAAFEAEALPVRLIVHGAVLTAWYGVFALQATLALAGFVRAHRMVGRAAVLFAIAVVVTGLQTALGYAPRLVAEDGLSVQAASSKVAAVVWGNLGMLALFAVFFALAIAAARARRIERHKRWMVMANVILLAPAFARIGRFDAVQAIGLSETPVIMTGLALTLSGFALAERRATGRIHPISLAAPFVMFAVLVVAGLAIPATPWGREVVIALSGV